MKTDPDAVSLAAAIDTFAAALTETAEHVRWRAAKAAVENDEQLSARLEEFQRLKLMARESYGQLKGKDAIRMGELQGEFEKNKLLAEQRKAIDALLVQLRSINQTITDRLDFDFAAACRPPSGCCG